MSEIQLPPYQIFGSEDSLDMDVVFFVNSIGSIHENLTTSKNYASELAYQYKIGQHINANLATVQQGLLSDVYKGTVDELNNALYHTYDLHDQHYPAMVSGVLPRDKQLKLLRTMRKTLSFFTRTKYRKTIKESLRGGFDQQVAFLRNVDITSIELQHVPSEDVWKVITFSVAQTLALYQGIELYTKRDIVHNFPELKAIINRQKEPDLSIARELLHQFTKLSMQQIDQGMTQMFEYPYSVQAKSK